jgi:uncharacterized membrane protein
MQPEQDRGKAMFLSEVLNFSLWIVVIEFIGALLIVAHILVAIISLLRGKSIAEARLLAADGAIMGLSFKLAGTLLKTIELHTWQQILLFVAIFALRTVLKRIFTWERVRLQHTLSQQELQVSTQATSPLSGR